MPVVTRRKTPSPQPRGQAFVTSVLDITLAKLADVGFERLSIPHVAELAGVNKTSIYRRWPGKDGLVRDALAAAMKHADQAPDTGTLRGDLIELARSVAAFMQSQVGTAVVRIMLAEGGNPDVRALVTPAYGQAAKLGPWVVLQRAVKRGELDGDVEPSLVLFTVAGAIMHRVFVERGELTDAFIHRVVDLVLLGAAAKRSR